MRFWILPRVAIALLGAVLFGALVASACFASPPPVTPPVTTFTGATLPSRLARGAPRPIGLTAGFTSEEAGGGPAPELDRIEIELSPRVSLRLAGRPLCHSRLLFKTTQTALEECGGSLVGRGTISSDIPTSVGGPTAHVEGETQFFYGLAEGRPMLLDRVETGQPMPLVYVIPFAIEGAPSGGLDLVAHKMRIRHGKCAAGSPHCFADPYGVNGIYSRVAAFELDLRRGRGRSSRLSASCPRGNRPTIPLERTELVYADGREVAGGSRALCR